MVISKCQLLTGAGEEALNLCFITEKASLRQTRSGAADSGMKFVYQVYIWRGPKALLSARDAFLSEGSHMLFCSHGSVSCFSPL